MAVNGFRDLVVWQRAMELTEDIYRLTERLPTKEQFGLIQQMRRAAVSVPSNIAEGHSRQSTGDFRRHLQMARGSIGELETQLTLSVRLKMLPSAATQPAEEKAQECSRMLAALIRRMRNEE